MRYVLDNKLQATDVARGFLSALDRPAHLHERGNRHRNIGRRQIAAHEGVGLERARTKYANPAVAQIMNTTVEFLGLGARRLVRYQTPYMHLKHLGKALMLTPFLI
jgi:hypothetical protein